MPITFDYHHHQFACRGLSYREAFGTARPTWGSAKPISHYSEPARLHGEDARPQAHADRVASVPDWLLEDSDVILEAKAKERALVGLRDGERRVAELA